MWRDIYIIMMSMIMAQPSLFKKSSFFLMALLLSQSISSVFLQPTDSDPFHVTESGECPGFTKVGECPSAEELKSECLTNDDCQKNEKCCTLDGCNLICVKVKQPPTPQVPVVCKKAVDLIIALDASGSVKQDWKKEVQFAQGVVKNFDIGEDASRIGIIYFGSVFFRHLDINKHGADKVTVEQKLNDLFAVEQFINKNYTMTHLALEDAVKMFRASPQSRNDIPKLLLVLTDGESTRHDKLIAPVDELKEMKAIRVIVGVALENLGPERRAQAKKELKFIASTIGGKSLDFEIKNFDLLLANVNKFVQAICEAPSKIVLPQFCKKAANVIIVLDASGSVKKQWQKQVSFAGNLTRDFEFGPNKSHLGIIYFSTQSVVHLNLNKQGMNNKDIEKKLGELRDVEKFISHANYTSTHLALLDAIEMFKAVSDERRSISNVLVVVTDGDSTYNSSYLDDPIKSLKSLNAVRITIGVGLEQLGERRRNKALKELDAMASSLAGKKLTYDIRTFDILLSDVSDFIETVCTAPGKIKQCGAVDIVFLLDSSWSIADYYFDDEIQFALKLGFSFEPINSERTRVGAIRFATRVDTIIDLNEVGSSSELVKEAFAQKIVQSDLGTQTHTEKALSNAVYMFRAVEQERTVPKVLVVLTDGLSTNGVESMVSQISSLKNDKVTIIAIGIDLSNNLPGNEFTKATKELEHMASTHPVSGKKLLYDIKSFNQVLEGIQALPNVKCEFKETTLLP